MSQPSNRRPNADASTAAPSLLERVLRLPRLIRIIIVALIALAAASLLDRLYPGSYFTDARTLTFILSVAAGLIAYIVGWYMLIGFSGAENTVQKGLGIYLFVGIVMIALVIGLTAFAIISSSI